jgi:hypothetical protein
MKNIAVIFLLITSTNLFAQNHPVAGDMPRYKIELTTANDNVLKGLLLEVKDSSILIYPGKRKDWRRKTLYTPVEFGYSNIQQIALENKNRALKRMLIVGAIVDSKGRKVFYINGSEPVFNEFKKRIQ